MSLSMENIKIIHMVARYRSYKITADQMHKVPSAVRYTIKQMEENLGVALFKKQGKQLVLTPAGKFFIKYSSDILHNMSDLIRNTVLVSDPTDLVYRVAINNIMSQRALIDFVECFAKRFPSTELQIINEVYNGCWDALYSKKVDLVRGAPHYPPVTEGIASTEIGMINWDFVVARDHSLAHEVCPLETSQLRSFAAICIKDTSVTLQPRQAWLLEGQKPIFVPDIESQISLIKRGVGIGYVPHFRVSDLLDSGQLIKKPMLEHKAPTMTFYAWNVKRKSSAQNWCINYLQQRHIKQNWCN